MLMWQVLRRPFSNFYYLYLCVVPVADPGFDLRGDVDFVNGGLGIEIKESVEG